MDEMKSWPSWSDFVRAEDEFSSSWAVQKGSAVGPSVAPKLTRLRKSSAVGKPETLVPVKALRIGLSSATAYAAAMIPSQMARMIREQEEHDQRMRAHRAAMQGFELDEFGQWQDVYTPNSQALSRLRRQLESCGPLTLDDLIGSPPPGTRWVPGVHDEYRLVEDKRPLVEYAHGKPTVRMGERSVLHAIASVKAGDTILIGDQLVTVTAVGGQSGDPEEFPALYAWAPEQELQSEDAAPAPRDEIKPELLKKRVSEW